MKKDCVQTSVLIPKKLYKEYKKQGLNLSKFVTEMLEYELYRDNSKFIKKRLEEEEDIDRHRDRKKNLLLAQLKAAEEKEELKKEHIARFKPEVRRYGTFVEEDSQ